MSRAGDVRCTRKASATSGVPGVGVEGWKTFKETSKGISYEFVEPSTLSGMCAIIYCSCSYHLSSTSPR